MVNYRDEMINKLKNKQVKADIVLMRFILGYPLTDQGGLCGGIPGAAKKINMYSKFKPVRIPGVVPYSDPLWWQGADGNCGIHIPSFSTSTIDKATGAWTYFPPRGNASEPYRLEDFMGYDHNARPPIKFIWPDVAYINTGVTTFMFGISAAEGSNLILSDIFTPNKQDELFFAVKAIATDGSVRYKTTAQSFVEGVFDTHIDMDIKKDVTLAPFRQGGTMKIFPFISSVSLTSWSSSFGRVGTCYPINVEEQKVELKSYIPPTEYRFEVEANMMIISRIVITVSVTNISDYTKLFRWDQITFKKSDSNGDSAQGSVNMTSVDGVSVSDKLPPISSEIRPGQMAVGKMYIAGSFSHVDTYSAHVDLYWWDPSFGTRGLDTFMVFYRTGGGVPDRS